MTLTTSLRLGLLSGLIASSALFAAAPIQHPDHFEFDAMLKADFRPDANGQRQLRLMFEYEGASQATRAAWVVDIVAPQGRVVRQFKGETALPGQTGAADLTWDGRDRAGGALPSGFYTVRLRAVPSLPSAEDAKRGLDHRIVEAFELARSEQVVQTYDVMVGNVAPPSMPYFRALPGPRDQAKATPAIGGLPYTVYYGNLHSQTNHSDGGAPVASCAGSQAPQGGQFGPTDAYNMMRAQAGGDFLLASEHNHMYDGSNSTNAAASPDAVKNLFNSGLTAASSSNAANPNFLALYGNEWGVISNGGHLNIVNPSGLVTWERNGSGQLLGHFEVAKSSYAPLYQLMQQQGWVGQFNHPASTAFNIGGTGLAFDANGAEVMVLSEVLNTSAFSTNTTETETGRSSFTSSWDTLLERGYKVAPASNQDNHCANWGLSARNRTGVLLPTGSALNQANFVAALRARRAFATEDRNAQLVLTANGRVMGETFSTSGSLTLTANYVSTSGQTASRVQFFEGVPGRNGTVTQLAEGSGTYTFTPSNGAHFYYAVVTQANGERLWSAPVWITQGGAAGDTTPPTVSASVAGSSGSITLSATASDNVGVARVEFSIDGTLVGTDTTSPYSLPFDSTTLANGTHSLTARAFDAAGNNATSTAVSFSVSNVSSTLFNETESNGSVAAANTVARTFTQIRGTMGNTTDKDFFRLTLNANETLRVDMTGPTGSTYDYDLFLVNASDVALKSSTGSTTTETLTYTNGASAQTVYAKVTSYAGSSTTLPYTLTLTYTASTTTTELAQNGGFESGSVNWTATAGVVTNSAGTAARTGSWKAWLNGNGSANTETLYQTVALPSSASQITASFWLKVISSETTTTQAYDTLKVQVRNSSNAVLATLATYSNLNKGTSFVQRSFDLTPYKGQSVRLYFLGVEGSSVATSFIVDDVSITSR